MKIEKGVPVPAPQDIRRTYPWADMEPGDSFFLASDVPRATQNAAKSSGAAWCARHRPDLKTVSRREDGGVRIWLVGRENAG